MYEEHWGLSEAPFENTPDPKFFFRSDQHEEGFSRLLYVIRRRKGAGMLSGVYGCGKTLIAHALSAELESDVYRVGMVTNPRMSATDILRQIVSSLGGDPAPQGKADAANALKKILVENLQDGKRTVVIVDEAHSIDSPETFEELRLLLNYQTEKEFLLTLLLLGQPELRDRVRQNKQFDQRIGMRYHLEPLGEAGTSAYVEHRMRMGGARHAVFLDEALSLIHERSGGIPRRINQIADAALLIGFGKRSERVDRTMVLEAVETVQGAA